MLDAQPVSSVLISMPGVGVRTATRILLEVGDVSAFPTSGYLAAHALICAGRSRLCAPGRCATAVTHSAAAVAAPMRGTGCCGSLVAYPAGE